MAEVEYRYLEVVKIGLAAAQARVPRLQASAIAEFGDILSRQVARGDWVQVGEDIVTAQGQDVIGVLEEMLATRPHWLVPAEVVDAQDDVWTSGNLEKQGQRWKEIRAVFQPGREGDALATKALREEAALFGTVPGSTKPGVKPGEKAVEDVPTKIPGANNPYSDAFRGTPAEKTARIASLIKSGGTKLAASLARAAGKTVTGEPLMPAGAARRS
jgi:hypothetical protein